jgi:mRNA interferase RelE/StbE
MYKIELLPSAQKDLDRLHGKIFNNIKKEIIQLSGNPRPYGSLKLTNEEGYRIRIGNHRVLYRIDDRAKEIFIYRVKQRKEAYR